MVTPRLTLLMVLGVKGAGPSSAMVTPRETLLMVLGVKVGVPETTSTATPVLNWFFLVSNSKKE